MKSEINKTAKKANETLHLPPPHPSLPKRGEGVSLLKTGVSWLKAGLTSLKQTLPTSLEKGGASRNQGKSKIEKQNKMKSKINELNSPSFTVLPLSSQERGGGEFVKSRDVFAKNRSVFIEKRTTDRVVGSNSEFVRNQ